MLEKLKSAKKRSIGTKQTAKALERGDATVVFIARDAEPHVVNKIVDECQAQSIELVYVDTMTELGRVCGIEVGAASAALIAECGEL